jgi:lipopolysaccharide transport system ATP-binding protein
MKKSEYNFAMFGTFDVENYGDILFPIIAKQCLQQRLGTVHLQRYSYHGKTPDNWPYEVTPVEAFCSSVRQCDGVIIGGGHLIRFDQDVAAGYAPGAPWISHPYGYWLSPGLLAAQHGIAVVWNAPSCLGAVPTWAESLLGALLRHSAYISVRDADSQQVLASLSGESQVELVPDSVFGLADLLDIRQTSAGFAQLRADWKISKPYIVIQAASAGLALFLAMLSEHASQFAAYDLVVLPVGPAVGDDAGVASFDLPGLIKLPFIRDPLLLAEVIGHAEGVVGSSLHLSITALVFGVPVFSSANLWEGKHKVLQDYELIFPLPIEGAIYPGWLLSRLGRRQPGAQVMRSRKRLEAHWDALAAALSGARSDSDAPGRLWFSLPKTMEGLSRQPELESATLALRLLQPRISELEREIMMIRNSRSYRLAAPVRAAGRVLKAMAKRIKS